MVRCSLFGSLTYAYMVVAFDMHIFFVVFLALSTTATMLLFVSISMRAGEFYSPISEFFAGLQKKQ